MENAITVTPIKVEATEDVEPSVSSSSTERQKGNRASQRKKPPTIETFWPVVLDDVRSIHQVDAKHQALPLARIKKIMKLDENTRMIAAEAPLLFAKACEYFIQELTLRAWVHTEESKRRTLQRSDIAQAISICDQFDFLIDIVPREEIKLATAAVKKEIDKQQAVSQTPSTVTVSTNNVQTNTQEQPMQYYIQVGGQQNQQQHSAAHMPTSNGIISNQQLSQQSLQGINIVTAPQNILLTTGNAGTQQQTATMVNSLQNPQQQIQLIQQVVTPNGDITNVPITITAHQLNLLRMQMQNNQAANALQTQQVLIPTQQQAQLVHIGGGNMTTTANVIQNPATGNIFLSTGHGNSIVSTDRNLGSTFRPNC